MRRPSPAINKRRRATHQRILIMTESLDVTPKTTEQNLIVRIGKSEAEVTKGPFIATQLNSTSSGVASL